MTQIRIPVDKLPPPNKDGDHAFQFRIISVDKNQWSAWSQLYLLKSTGQYRPAASDIIMTIGTDQIVASWETPILYNNPTVAQLPDSVVTAVEPSTPGLGSAKYTSPAHPFIPGNLVDIVGSDVPTYNGTFPIVDVGLNDFIVANSETASATFTSGSATAYSSVIEYNNAQNLKQGNTNIFLEWKYNNFNNSLEKKVQASDLGNCLNFGQVSAISNDGNTIIVGAPSEVSAFNYEDYEAGAYVFVKSSSGDWIEQAKLLPTSVSDPYSFGQSLAISADGNTVAVAANWEDNESISGINNGAVYIYVRSGSIWSLQQKIIPSDNQNDDAFGNSIALSSDGNTLICGAAAESTSPTTINGAAYVYVRSGSAWTQETKLLASDKQSNDSFGSSVSLSSDGNTAAIGSPGSSSESGAVYVYTRSSTTWTFQQKLVASDSASLEYFALNLDLASDGNTLIVGAFQENTSPNTANGAAYIFIRSTGVWTQQAKLIASDKQDYDNFGWSVALSGNDGNTAIVGVPGRSTSTGVIYFFSRSGSSWTEQGSYVSDSLEGQEYFGISVSLTGDGSIALVGAPKVDTAEGSLYIYQKDKGFSYHATVSTDTTNIIVPTDSASVRVIGMLPTKDVPVKGDYESDFDFQVRLNEYLGDPDSPTTGSAYDLFTIFDTGVVSLVE